MKAAETSPQHFILSSNGRPKFKGLNEAEGSAVGVSSPAISNNYTTMPAVSYNAHRGDDRVEYQSTNGKTSGFAFVKITLHLFV